MGIVNREVLRRNPAKLGYRQAAAQLDDAADVYLDKLRPGATVNYDVYENTPKGKGIKGRLDDFVNISKFGSSGVDPATGKEGIAINPNTDRAIYAHELGHTVGRQTDVGRFISNARNNPKVSNALLGAALLTPGIAAGLTPGDEDLATSVGLAYATQIPTIADEINATRHGLGIMNTAGMRATLGQRGKLAGALLTYAGAPLLLGVSGNVLGNLVDEEQTPSTLMP